MARDMQMEMEINPVLNTKVFDSELKKLEKQLRSLRSGEHKNTSALGSRLIQSMIASGQATTTTQARMIIEGRMGGGFSQEAKANLRVAQNKAQIAINEQKQITTAQLVQERQENLAIARAKASEEKEQKQKEQAAARANIIKENQEKKDAKTLSRVGWATWSLNNRFEKLKSAPTTQGTNAFIADVKAMRTELFKLYQEYRLNRREVPQFLRQIAQNTQNMIREVSDWDLGDNKDEKGSSFKSVLGKLSSLVGIGTIIKKGYEGFRHTLDRGMQALRLEAAYGRDVNWGDVRARAGIFNMSTEAAMAPSKYASDFRQRMMWGEVSEREIIGLSRAGKWGRMVMSGAAARNPEAANQAFEELVVNTDKAKMRSILGQLGLTQELMGYNVQPYDQKIRQEYTDQFKEMAAAELNVAKALYDAGNQIQVALEKASTLIGVGAAETVKATDPQSREVAKRLGETTSAQEQIVYAQYKQKKKEEAIQFGMHMLNPFVRLKDNFQGSNNNAPTINITNNNANTFNGVSNDTVSEIMDEMDAYQSKSYYEDLTKTIPGAISSVHG